MASLQYSDITVSMEQPFRIFVFHLLLRYLHFFFFLLFLPLSDRNDSIKHTNRRDKSMRGVSLNGVYFLTITQFFFQLSQVDTLLFIFTFSVTIIFVSQTEIRKRKKIINGRFIQRIDRVLIGDSFFLFFFFF